MNFLSVVSHKKIWDRHIRCRAAVWTSIVSLERNRNRRKMLMSKACLLEGEYRGARVRVDKKELVEMQASRKR